MLDCNRMDDFFDSPGHYKYISHSRIRKMFSEFPIDAIKQKINYIVDVAVPLPFTHESIIYDRCPLGVWTISSEKWHDEKGNKYSLRIDVDDKWIVRQNEISLCPLEYLGSYLSPKTGIAKGTPKTSAESPFLGFLGCLSMVFGILFLLFYVFSGNASKDSEKRDREYQEQQIRCGTYKATDFSMYARSGCMK
jgi:hypothetical protein